MAPTVCTYWSFYVANVFPPSPDVQSQLVHYPLTLNLKTLSKASQWEAIKMNNVWPKDCLCGLLPALVLTLITMQKYYKRCKTHLQYIQQLQLCIIPFTQTLEFFTQPKMDKVNIFLSQDQKKMNMLFVLLKQMHTKKQHWIGGKTRLSKNSWGKKILEPTYNVDPVYMKQSFYIPTSSNTSLTDSWLAEIKTASLSVQFFFRSAKFSFVVIYVTSPLEGVP